MIKVVCKSGNLANLLRSTAAIGTTTIVPPAPSVPEKEPPRYPLTPGKLTAYSAACSLPIKKMTVAIGPSVKFSIRYNHTDVKVPDFTPYRRKGCRDPTVNNREYLVTQKFYTSVMTGIGGGAAIYGAKCIIRTFVEMLAPSAAVLAMAKIEINKSDVPEGKNVTFKWRGKPLFVRHRTSSEIKTEEAVDVNSLRDPEPDSVRVKDPEWLVVIGVCTHLGCVPIANQGDWGGYYCPCHGSHYDASGRIRKGPAPTNLEVPPYEFVGDTIVVG